MVGKSCCTSTKGPRPCAKAGGLRRSRLVVLFLLLFGRCKRCVVLARRESRVRTPVSRCHRWGCRVAGARAESGEYESGPSTRHGHDRVAVVYSKDSCRWSAPVRGGGSARRRAVGRLSGGKVWRDACAPPPAALGRADSVRVDLDGRAARVSCEGQTAQDASRDLRCNPAFLPPSGGSVRPNQERHTLAAKRAMHLLPGAQAGPSGSRSPNARTIEKRVSLRRRR